MKFRGNGKYSITIKGQEIEDVTISDIRQFFDTLDPMLKEELANSVKKQYKNGRYSINDIKIFLKSEEEFIGNLSTGFVKDIYSHLNKEKPLSKKMAAKIIAKKFNKSIKTVEKHLYKNI